MNVRIRQYLIGVTLLLATASSGFAAIFVSDELTLQSGLEALALGNYGESYWLWRPLADEGNAEAQHHIGWLYANGHGLKVDVPKAIYWWEKAASSGHADSQFAIGMTYLTGDGDTIKKNVSEAIHWLVKAANNGSADARELVLQLRETRRQKLLKLYPNIEQEPWMQNPEKLEDGAAKKAD